MTTIRKSINPYRCCWHCRYYVRPINLPGLIDGPVTEICTVDEPSDPYPDDQWRLGGKEVSPDDVCDRFEIDPPPRR